VLISLALADAASIESIKRTATTRYIEVKRIEEPPVASVTKQTNALARVLEKDSCHLLL